MTGSSSIKAQIASIISQDGDGIAGITPLMNFALNEDEQAVKFFAKSGSAVVNQKNVGGASALHIAARKGNLEICKILVDNGADVNSSDNEGWTPLMRAAISENVDLIKLLINSGADIKKANSNGETSIIISATSECSTCLEVMLSNYSLANDAEVDFLKNQLNKAVIIAENKGDVPTQAILKEYLISGLNNSEDAKEKFTTAQRSAEDLPSPTSNDQKTSELIDNANGLGNEVKNDHKSELLKPLDDHLTVAYTDKNPNAKIFDEETNKNLPIANQDLIPIKQINKIYKFLSKKVSDVAKISSATGDGVGNDKANQQIIIADGAKVFDAKNASDGNYKRFIFMGKKIQISLSKNIPLNKDFNNQINVAKNEYFLPAESPPAINDVKHQQNYNGTTKTAAIKYKFVGKRFKLNNTNTNSDINSDGSKNIGSIGNINKTE